MKHHDISAIQFHLYFWQTPFNDSQAVLTNTVARHPIMKHRVNPAHLMRPLENFQTPIFPGHRVKGNEDRSHIRKHIPHSLPIGIILLIAESDHTRIFQDNFIMIQAYGIVKKYSNRSKVDARRVALAKTSFPMDHSTQKLFLKSHPTLHDCRTIAEPMPFSCPE